MSTKAGIGVLMAAAVMSVVFNVVGVQAQGAKNAHLVPAPQGVKQKLQGVISTRENDSFKMRDPGGAETIVLITVACV